MVADPDTATILTECDMDDVMSLGFIGGEAAAFSDRCPSKPTPNEDAAGLLPLGGGRGVLVVADGLGGRPGGATASARTVECIKRSVTGVGDGEDAMRAAIIEGIEQANRELLEMGTGAATTVAVAEIDGATVRTYHVGDSVILVIGQRGKLKLQTVAHSPVGFGEASGLMDEAEAMSHPERHIVANIVGAHDMRIEVGSRKELAPRDTVVLASDGLVDNLYVGEIADIVRAGPLGDAAGRLVGTCKARMAGTSNDEPCKPDDLTVIVYRPPSQTGVSSTHE